ncbi:SDR family NAD(P)-dependent oxidoreductase [Rugosimonospora africana]|uniref:Putative short chain dehydrogenase/reductase n=1 Tax=Rugosimonospora africana TaxID=556532 RepID=A0A8J3VTY0_9ACTN|nr:SDR family NAD(P)-dependent oxidoreductase [Rugosimonospora africana]GIH18655.1 putative short chain dehydrogenase/reductase [Rugosimonospora africana]
MAAITGGARGIGLAVARALVARGARVAVGDLDGELAGLAAQRIGALGLTLDVRDEQSFEAFLATVRESLGPVDVLVNSAGLAAIGGFIGSSPEEQSAMFGVNSGGVARGMRLVLPSMVSRGSGRVVNIASASGRISAPNAAVYSASKHAVVALTEAVQFELLGTGVRLTAVMPSLVSTEMAAGLTIRGIQRVTADRVAASVVRILRREHPPLTVMIPGWLRGIAAIDTVSPLWMRSLARRFVSVRADRSSEESAFYRERMRRQAHESAPPPLSRRPGATE